MATLLFCFETLLIFGLFHRRAEATRSTVLNTALIAYNREFDTCKGVTDETQGESKLAADQACDRAFHALDDLELNTCYGWRHAACRVVPGDEYQYHQCTCKITYCDHFSVKSKEVQSFRVCASNLLADELATGLIPAPTTDFQETRSRYDEALDAADFRRSYNYSGWYDGADTTSGALTSLGASSSGGVLASGGTGFLSGAQTLRGSERSWGSWGTLTSGYGDPSAFSLYTPGPSSGAPSRRAAEQPRLFPCDQCDSKLVSARALFDHKRVHHTVGDLHCYLCNRDYSSRKTFLAHLQGMHPEIAIEEVVSHRRSAEAQALLPHLCNFCQRRFSTRNSLLKHRKSHTTNETKCHECNRTFSMRSSFKRHMKKTHPGVPIPAAGPTVRRRGPDNLECEVCGKKYTTLTGLRQHTRSHRTLDTYCLFCDINFGTIEGYKKHAESRHPKYAALESEEAKEAKPEKCPQCDKRFKNPLGLREHMDVHDGKTTCDICNKVLSRKSALVAHKKKEHK